MIVELEEWCCFNQVDRGDRSQVKLGQRREWLQGVNHEKIWDRKFRVEEQIARAKVLMWK